MSSNPGEDWLYVGKAEDIDDDDVIRFDYNGRTFAVYNTSAGYFATDGICTHEEAHLADGLVIDDVIECPLHQGRFHIPSGKAKNAPVCVDLRTYPVKLQGEELFIDLGGSKLVEREGVPG